MVDVTDDTFKDEVLSKEKAVVDFWAEWCGPCQAFKPVFEEVSKEMDGVTFAKVDIDQNGGVAQEYGIRSIPTLLFFKDGKEVGRQSGLMPKEDFVKKIEEMLG